MRWRNTPNATVALAGFDFSEIAVTFSQRGMKAILSTLLAIAFTGSAFAADADATGTNITVEPYLRIDESRANTVELQIALRQFTPRKGKGPAIWLAAVAHIGETNYFRKLQEHLEEHELVLFEGIMPKRKRAWSGSEFAQMQNAFPEAAEDAGLQTQLASALGLAFQLKAIDYDKANYRNSDLALQDLQSSMMGESPQPDDTPRVVKEEEGEMKDENSPDTETSGDSSADESGESEESNESLNELMAIMHGEGFLGSIVKFGVAVIAANPKLQAITKLTFVEVLGGLKGDLANTKAVPPQLAQLLKVLIHGRNQKVIQDLRKELRRDEPPASISVFYGAGHMDDLERRVRNQLDYIPVKDLWVPAFSVDLEASGISAWERNMVRFMTERQLQMLSPDNE